MIRMEEFVLTERGVCDGLVHRMISEGFPVPVQHLVAKQKSIKMLLMHVIGVIPFTF